MSSGLITKIGWSSDTFKHYLQARTTSENNLLILYAKQPMKNKMTNPNKKIHWVKGSLHYQKEWQEKMLALEFPRRAKEATERHAELTSYRLLHSCNAWVPTPRVPWYSSLRARTLSSRLFGSLSVCMRMKWWTFRIVSWTLIIPISIYRSPPTCAHILKTQPQQCSDYVGTLSLLKAKEWKGSILIF